MLVASTAPAASTGVSWLHAVPCVSISCDLLVHVVIWTPGVPRVISRDTRAIAYGAGGRGGARRRRCSGRGPRGGGHLSPAHPVIAIANLDLARGVFQHVDEAACRRLMALPFQCNSRLA